ncbi:UDP-N-acetylmuramoyl-tripeptide--D-alanyl-D-alanine ligase [Risungbinella massiliensis]|uniref:UDP-N-acetylmuramoyl-tripeptide--D-alanyl-D- alanine ligase n=1 Tax=Risungbinella massiliensis TaxID=1329796 RepID=UPI00069AFA07|nr:UDP-N-acetylmuramoyl-tripeptide--D-alanyl-D-alanine ligase [Risungbinella massiliensis]
MKARLSWIQEVTKADLLSIVPSDEALIAWGVSTDTRTLQENQLFVPLVGDQFNGHHYLDRAVAQGAVAAFWQKDHPVPADLKVPLLLVEDTLTALQQLAHAYRMTLDIPIIGITGSNGKTTTKDLVASVLQTRFRVHKTKGNLNNHIGLPLTLLSIEEETEIAVVEMGMSGKGEIALLSQITRPTHAIITNIGESHIEFLGSREAIAEAKLEILEGLSTKGMFVYDGEEPLLQERVKSITQQKIPVGWSKEQVDSPEDIEMEGDTYTFISRKSQHRFTLPILGRHNILNALYAIEIGRALGLTEDEIATGLSQVTVTGMRLEKVTGKNGITIINDAYNASPTSMKAALHLLVEIEPDREKWALLGEIREIGGTWEEEYHRDLGRNAVELGIDCLLTVGEKGKWIADGAKERNHEGKLQIHSFVDRQEASNWLLQHSNENTVLLVKASRGAQLDQVVKIITEGA